MSSIDDLLGGMGGKATLVDRARASTKAVLVHQPEGSKPSDGVHEVAWYGLTRGDLAYAIMRLVEEFMQTEAVEDDDD